jgi:hypothetical protein
VWRLNGKRACSEALGDDLSHSKATKELRYGPCALVDDFLVAKAV